MITHEQLLEGVDEDGTCEPWQGVETDYASCEAVISVPHGDSGYVSVIADYQDRFVETRILFETLEGAGWTRPGTNGQPQAPDPSEEAE